ncbi:MAG: hypothetical protein SNJ29_09105 [Rikenellaceae bacterium]
MAKKEPTEQDVQEFMDKQSKLYDAKEGYEREKELAIEKGNPTMYKEAERKDKAADEEIERNIDDWDKEHGCGDYAENKEGEQQAEVEQQAEAEQQAEVEQEDEMEK